MSELMADNWMDEPTSADQDSGSCHPPPQHHSVTNTVLWLDWYAKIAAVLSVCLPLKALEFCAYKVQLFFLVSKQQEE